MQENTIWTVSDVNLALKDLIEGSLYPIWLNGEVGTLQIHRSGHVYLTIKDKNSQIKGVFFNGAKIATNMNLSVGTQVEVFGKLTVYEPRGEYQLAVSKMRPVGIGNLQMRFEKLKKMLSDEGLFSEIRKKKLPLLPNQIGVVTSPGGAAIRDFLQIIERRFPNIVIKIYPTPVQGLGVEKQISAGVNFFNRTKSVDVIIVTRGGGSMEDLWAFNEEILARTIADSQIPVISAIGHEIDFTICDFVADKRVPTPSAAAELVIGRQEEFVEYINNCQKRIKYAIELYLEKFQRRFERLSNSYVFKEPIHLVREKQQKIDELTHNIELFINQKKEREFAKLAQIEARLKNLDPFSVLKRGYSVLTDKKTGTIITSHKIQQGSQVSARVSDGNIDMTVD